MTPLLIGIALVSLLFSYLCVGRYRLWAEKRRILDLPNERSAHTRPVARGGGIVIASVSLLGVWIVFRLVAAANGWQALLAYTLGAVLIAAVSWLDDLRSLPSWIRFAAHSLGAVIALAGVGYWTALNVPILGSVPLGRFGIVVTFAWIVGLTNAYNFMDGIDGLAGAQAVIAGLGWVLLGWHGHETLVAALGVLLATTSLGFLGYNWPPARLFMGDVGSAFLGYSFALLPLLYARIPGGRDCGGAPLLGALLVWPFLFDTTFTLLRRLSRRENVFSAHKTHLYQRLVSVGRSQRSVTLLYGVLALTGAALGEVWSPDSAGGSVPGFLIVPLLCFGLWAYVRNREQDSSYLRPSMRVRLLPYRRLAIVASQAVLFSLSYFLSFFLRLDFSLNEPYLSTFLVTLPLALVIKLGVFAAFRLFRGWWRYVGVSDLLDIIKAAAVSAPLLCAGVYFTHGFMDYPRSVFLIDPIMTVIIIGGVRFAVRLNAEHARRYTARAATVIVGAGQAGSSIARELNSNEKLDYYPIGFVDDDPTKKGVRIQGIKVLGSTQELPGIIAENQVAHVLIAIPSATGRQMQRIIDICRQCSVDFKTLPALGDIINGSVSARQIRSVRVEDLLAREPVRLDQEKMRARFLGKAVFITGAAGSIGSELARQLAGIGAAKLLLFDQSESGLFEIDHALRERFPSVQCVPVIGDILDPARVRETLLAHRPQSVFHAAAYKHVPMMEQHCFLAVRNNVFGTYNVALASGQCDVEDFVLISSDKAVNPGSIMGVTKRVAELTILGLPRRKTSYISVRFGNVMGSRGSVIPVFEQQIANRKPVTITDPEARRYFMTVSEAVQLVLQASTMGSGGEIFVLDMGEPVKVADLARSLIRLSGLEPDRDIPVVFTGLRPGEKLFEELKLGAEGIKPTVHEKIWVLDGGGPSHSEVTDWLAELDAQICAKSVNGLVSELKKIVPEYTPSSEILSLADRDR